MSYWSFRLRCKHGGLRNAWGFGQRLLQDLRQILVRESTPVLFAWLDDSFSPLPISHSYLYSEAQIPQLYRVPASDSNQSLLPSPFFLPISGKMNKVVVQDNRGEKADSSGGRVGFSCSLRKLPLLSEILFLSHLSFPDTLIPFIMKQGVGADLDFAEKVFGSGPSLQRPYRFPG